VLDVLDSLLELAEPGGEIDPASSLRVATSGSHVDHTGARPLAIDLDADCWYGWLLSDRHETFEVGNPPSEREVFAFAVLYVAASSEQAKEARSREVSDLIDGRAHGFLGRLAGKRSNLPVWSEAEGAIDQAIITGLSVRGVGLRVTGYRYHTT
jgi:hypothetical protein